MKTRRGQFVGSPMLWILSSLLIAILLSVACGSEPQAADSSSRENAPSFELPEARGGMLSLSQLLDGRDATALVFYRGYF